MVDITQKPIGIPKEERKKILLLSDDLRFHSGIATVSRELVLGTLDQFNWVQLGAAARHPDENKVFDLSTSLNEEFNVDSSVKIYCSTGYGNSIKLKEILALEKPDAILHFTDPRYWEWLYLMENEIRQDIPIMYLNIWDDLPDPQYNETAYASCDLLYSISKQTYGINKRVLDRFKHKNIPDTEIFNIESLNGGTVLSYLPHGINEDNFKPITETDSLYEEYIKFKTSQKLDNKFIVFWNNRNIYRKQPSTLILAFKYFVDKVKETEGEEAAKKLNLLLHTQPLDEMGTDLPAVIRSLAPDYNITITNQNLDTKTLNFLYNISDVSVNITSNEGFGLGTAESVMAGTPIIVNITGGLQDQVGIINKNTNDYYTAEEYIKEGSLHSTKDLEHGEWCEPVYPSNRSIQGSIPTPYIFDDRVDFEDLALALTKMYANGREKNKEYGLKGREYMLSSKTLLSAKVMCNKFSNITKEFLKKWTPTKRYTFINSDNHKVERYVGDTVLYTNKHNEQIINTLKEK